MSDGKLWSRMTAWMRPGGRGDAHASSAGASGVRTGGDEPGLLTVPTRRVDPTLTRLEEGYAKVIELVDAIKRHQQGQQERAGEVASSLAQVATTLERIDDAGRRQADQLAIIAEEVRAGGHRAAHWEEVLCEFPRMAESQREALSAVARQIEEVGNRDCELAGSLNAFRDAVSTLSDATTASSVAIKDLQRASLEQQERTAALIREQNRRFTMLFVVTLVLAVLGVIAGLVSLTQGG